MAEKKYLTQAGLERIFGVVRQWDKALKDEVKDLINESEGVNEELVQDALDNLANHIDDTDVHVTAKDKEAWDTAKNQIASIIGAANNNGKIDRWMEIVNLLDNTPEGANLANLFSQKVDKVEGKGLSTNDFTTALKNKLDGIESGANKYIHPTATAKTITAAVGKVLSGITVNGTGHVTSVTEKTLTAADIADLTEFTNAEIDATAKAAEAVTLT